MLETPLAEVESSLDAEVRPESAYRILVLTDKLGATQSISFVHPTKSNPHAFESVDLYTQSGSQFDYLAHESYWRNEKPSVLVLSRYTDAKVLPLLELARKHGVPSIFHLDDDLLDVPLSLGAERYEFYQNPEKLQNLRLALNLVDLVYASTGPLAQRLVDHGITNDIFTGELYCSVDPAALRTPLPSTGPVFGYMGTGGHSQDLALALPTVARLMREMPTLRFETFGTVPPPPELAEFGSRYCHHSGVINYTGFLDRLAELGWWVGIAPLEDNAFNRCKADTKWVEYTLAGMAVVASDLPVYHRACEGGSGKLAATAEDWHGHLGSLLRDGRLRSAQIATARAKLTRLYTHASLQRQLVAVIERATKAFRLHQSMS